jgi:hypothetical protein
MKSSLAAPRPTKLRLSKETLKALRVRSSVKAGAAHASGVCFSVVPAHCDGTTVCPV